MTGDYQSILVNQNKSCSAFLIIKYNGEKNRLKNLRAFMSSIIIQPTGPLLPTVISMGCELPKLHYVCGGIFKLNISYFTYRRILRQAALLLFIKIMQLIAPALTGRHASTVCGETDVEFNQDEFQAAAKILSHLTHSVAMAFPKWVVGVNLPSALSCVPSCALSFKICLSENLL